MSGVRSPAAPISCSPGSICARCSPVKPRSRLAAPTYQWVLKIAIGSSKPGSTCSTRAPSSANARAAPATRSGDLRLHRGEAEGRAERDPQPAHAVLEADPVVAAVMGQGEPVAAVGQGQHVQHQRGVAHAAGHRAEVGDRAERAQRPGRHPAEGGLEAEDAGEARRDPDRAAAVGAEVQGAHAERAGGRGAAARAAGRPAGVPGIAGDPGERAVGDRLPAELRRGGLADQHRTLLAQARRGRGVLVPGLLARDREAAAQGRPAPGQDQILDRDRDAVDQAARFAPLPARFRSPRRLQRLVGIDQAERVDRRIEALDPVEHGAGGLDRRQLPAAVRRNSSVALSAAGSLAMAFSARNGLRRDASRSVGKAGPGARARRSTELPARNPPSPARRSWPTGEPSVERMAGP